MSKNEIKLDAPGRSAPARRLSWTETKEQLQRTLSHTPEVMVRVSGGGKTVQHVKDHLDYITRNGKLEAVDDKHEKISGKFSVAALHDAWDLDIGRGQGKNRQAFNLVLSMPAGTNPQKLFTAAQHFAQEQFGGRHHYAMVLHTPETDPHKNPPKHPHVHLVVKAEDQSGKRLNIRKVTLQLWRVSFAEKLREQGIAANATPRYSRGIVTKSKTSSEYHILKRKAQSDALLRRFDEAGKELHNGDTAPKPWEYAIAARRRDTLRELAEQAARLRQEGNLAFAQEVERHARDLPALDTERHQMKRTIAQQVLMRRKEQELINNRDIEK